MEAAQFRPLMRRKLMSSTQHRFFHEEYETFLNTPTGSGQLRLSATHITQPHPLHGQPQNFIGVRVAAKSPGSNLNVVILLDACQPSDEINSFVTTLMSKLEGVNRIGIVMNGVVARPLSKVSPADLSEVEARLKKISCIKCKGHGSLFEASSQFHRVMAQSTDPNEQYRIVLILPQDDLSEKDRQLYRKSLACQISTNAMARIFTTVYDFSRKESSGGSDSFAKLVDSTRGCSFFRISSHPSLESMLRNVWSTVHVAFLEVSIRLDASDDHRFEVEESHGGKLKVVYDPWKSCKLSDYALFRLSNDSEDTTFSSVPMRVRVTELAGDTHDFRTRLKLTPSSGDNDLAWAVLVHRLVRLSEEISSNPYGESYERRIIAFKSHLSHQQMALNVPSQACRPEEELLEQMLSFERTRVVQREVPCRSSRRKRVPTSTSDISMCFARGNVPMDSELLDDVELPKLSELDITSSAMQNTPNGKRRKKDRTTWPMSPLPDQESKRRKNSIPRRRKDVTCQERTAKSSVLPAREIHIPDDEIPYSDKFKRAAFIILHREARPMTVTKVIQMAIAEGLVQTNGRTPERTLAARLYTDISENPHCSFVKTAPATFALKAYAGRGT